MEPILIDDRLDPGQFGDLMDHRLWVVASEPLTAAATDLRLAVECLADLLGRDQDAMGFAMSGLATASFPTGKCRGFPLHPDRVGRGGFRRVGGVELEPVLKITESVFQAGDPLLVGLDESDDLRL
jgi:hypothetical protein